LAGPALAASGRRAIRRLGVVRLRAEPATGPVLEPTLVPFSLLSSAHAGAGSSPDPPGPVAESSRRRARLPLEWLAIAALAALVAGALLVPRDTRRAIPARPAQPTAIVGHGARLAAVRELSADG